MNNNPAADLIALKKICSELQKELAYAVPDAELVERLADDVVHLGDRLAAWARVQ